MINKPKYKLFICEFLRRYNGINDDKLIDIITARNQTIEKAIGNEKAEEAAVKLLISSLKGFCKNHLKGSEFSFDEKFIKEQILDREISEDQTGMSKIDGTIIGINVVAHYGDFNKETAGIINTFAFTKGPNFKINCLYEDVSGLDDLKKRIKPDYLNQVNFVEFRGHKGLIIRKDFVNPFVGDGAALLKNGTVLEPAKAGDQRSYYKELAFVAGSDVYQSELIFQRNNMFQTEKTLFLGYDELKPNIVRELHPDFTLKQVMEESANKSLPADLDPKILQKVIKQFEKEFGKQVIVLGLKKDAEGNYTSYPAMIQPLPSLAVFLSPIDEGLISVDEFITQDKLCIYGARFLDQLTQQLREEGFNFLRVPCYPFIAKGQIFAYSYNDTLVEKYTDEKGIVRKRAFLPSYILPEDTPFFAEVQKAGANAIKLYQSLGYQVVAVPIFDQTIKTQSSLNARVFELRG